jgi:hypothetical protein
MIFNLSLIKGNRFNPLLLFLINVRAVFLSLGQSQHLVVSVTVFLSLVQSQHLVVSAEAFQAKVSLEQKLENSKQ